MAEHHSDKPDRPCGTALVDIKDYFTLWLIKLEDFQDERDQANKESVKAAFNAAEKASEKTEAALKEYKLGANEWRDTVKDLISGLTQARAVTTDQADRSKDTKAWLIPLLIIGSIALVNLILNLINLQQR